MLQSLTLFLAPAATPLVNAPQTVQPPPPAVAGVAARRPGGRAASLAFLARVIGSAVGFAVLFGGCWFTLQLLQVFL